MQKAFTNNNSFSISDIIAFYRQYEGDVKRGTIDWRIYDMVKKGLLYRVSRGQYSFSQKKTNKFIPEINKPFKNLSRKIYKQFPFIDTCVWSTKWLNEFMVHQPFMFYTILEVEKDAMEAVFYALKDEGLGVFLDPSQEILDKYASNFQEPIIILKLTSEAPTQIIDNVVTQTIEKLLVDIYCDQEIFSAFQGTELKGIYEAVFQKYDVNKTKMLRYAGRRNKRAEIEQFVQGITKKWQ